MYKTVCLKCVIKTIVTIVIFWLQLISLKMVSTLQITRFYCNYDYYFLWISRLKI